MGKTFVYNTGESKPKKDEIWLEFGMFFDGTLNNKDNTLLRMMVKEGVPRKATEKEKKIYKAGSNRSIGDQQGVDNSYSNDFTNVARLWQHCEQQKYAIYVEGIGSVTYAQDDGDGFMFGAGKAGIRMKVRSGCKELAKRIGDAKKDKKKNKDKKITKITLDAFGFSRGATAARNFVHEVNVKKSYMVKGYLEHKMKKEYDKQQRERYDKQKEWESKGGVIAKQDNLHVKPILVRDTPLLDDDGERVSEDALKDGMLPSKGYLGYMLLQNGFTFEEVEALDIRIRFVGVYDTVSSYYKEKSVTKFFIDQEFGNPDGNKYFANDVEELGLKNLGALQKAVHFTAMNEHRYNFALTRLPGATEKAFPGVHCDIGGAYLNEKEIVDEIEIAFTPSTFPTRKAKQKSVYLLKKGFWGDDAKKKLIEYSETLIKRCWYKSNQLFINNMNTLNYNGYKIPFPPSANGLYDKLTGIRFLRKEYSYIPLLFMEEYFKKTLGTASTKKNIPQESQFIQKFSVKDFPTLQKAQDYLRPYVMENNGKPWKYLSDEHIKLKDEILAKKKKKLMKKAEEEAIKSKKEKLYPPTKRDGYLAQVHRENELKKKYHESIYNKRIDEMEKRHIKTLSSQGVLEILRNEYFHWSANKDWFGMNPTESRKRRKY